MELRPRHESLIDSSAQMLYALEEHSVLLLRAPVAAVAVRPATSVVQPVSLPETRVTRVALRATLLEDLFLLHPSPFTHPSFRAHLTLSKQASAVFPDSEIQNERENRENPKTL